MKARLTFFVLALISLVFASDRNLEAPQAVRELDASKVLRFSSTDRQEFCQGHSLHKPVAIRNASQLAECFPDVAIRKRIRKVVDFDLDQIILFAWQGSRNDPPVRAEPDPDGTSVTIHEQPLAEERSKLIGHHIQLFVIGQEKTWSYTPPQK